MARILSYLPEAELSRRRPPAASRAVGGNSHRELAHGAHRRDAASGLRDRSCASSSSCKAGCATTPTRLTGPLGAFYEFVVDQPLPVPGLSPNLGARSPPTTRCADASFARRTVGTTTRCWLGLVRAAQLTLRENGQAAAGRTPQEPDPLTFELPDYGVVLGGVEGKVELTIREGRISLSGRSNLDRGPEPRRHAVPD